MPRYLVRALSDIFGEPVAECHFKNQYFDTHLVLTVRNATRPTIVLFRSRTSRTLALGCSAQHVLDTVNTQHKAL